MKKLLSIVAALFLIADAFAHNDNSLKKEIPDNNLTKQWTLIETIPSSDPTLLLELEAFQHLLDNYILLNKDPVVFSDAENALFIRLNQRTKDLIRLISQPDINIIDFIKLKNEIRQDLFKLQDLRTESSLYINHRILQLTRLLGLLLLISAIFIIILTFSSRKYRNEKDFLRLLNKTIADTQELERRNISHDLHDTVAQDLKGIRFITGALTSDKVHSIEEIKALSKEADQITNKAILEIRTICYNLTPPELEYNRLTEAILTQAANFQQKCNIEIPVAVNCSETIDSFSKEKQLHIYRIIQEAFENIEKHSHAHEASIVIREDRNYIFIIICDDGIGFTQKNESSQNHKTADKKHFGLLGMKDRVKSLNGSIEILSEENMGTEIKIKIPIV